MTHNLFVLLDKEGGESQSSKNLLLCEDKSNDSSITLLLHYDSRCMSAVLIRIDLKRTWCCFDNTDRDKDIELLPTGISVSFRIVVHGGTVGELFHDEPPRP